MRLGQRKWSLMRLTSVVLVMVLGVFGVHVQGKSVINVYSSGDTHITDWLQLSIMGCFIGSFLTSHQKSKMAQQTGTLTNSR